MILILNTGMILKARYYILEQIGKGGEGHLYLARDLELGVLWAVKEIPQKRKSEAKLQRLLDHPALPKMIDYIEKGEFCYLVMEYIKGKSLLECVYEKRSFSANELLKIGITVSNVLEYMHSLHPPVFYGDLKPENLMLTESGDVYLIDFGTAVQAYGGTGRSYMGTHGYAAPEQYKGEVWENSDVFGFGKTMLTLSARTKKTEILKNLRMFWIFVRCSFPEAMLRYKRINDVQQLLQQIYRGKKKIRNGFFVGGFTAFLCMIFFASMYEKNQIPLEGALYETMQPCYEWDFLNAEEKDIVLEETEEKLQELLKHYGDKNAQRKILLMLALNDELLQEWKKSALYYEQLLLYEPSFRKAYEEYGSYLLRLGQEKESKALWKSYEKNAREGKLEGNNGINFLNWCRQSGGTETEHFYRKAGRGMEVGGFGVSIGTENLDGWWNQMEEKYEAVENDTSDLKPVEIITPEEKKEEISEQNSLPALDEEKMDHKEDAVQKENPIEKEKNTDEKKNEFSNREPQEMKIKTDNSNTEKKPVPTGMTPTISANHIEKNTTEKKKELMNVKPTERVTETLIETTTTAETTVEPPIETTTERQMESTTDVITQNAIQLFPVYFDTEVFYKESEIKKVQIKKRTFNIKGKTEVRLKIQAEGAVHILSIRTGEKECMWSESGETYRLSLDNSEAERLEMLLVYEEKMSAPFISLT